MEQLTAELWGVLKEQGFAVIVVALVAWRLDQRMSAMLSMVERMVEQCWERLLAGRD